MADALTLAWRKYSKDRGGFLTPVEYGAFQAGWWAAMQAALDGNPENPPVPHNPPKRGSTQ